MAPSVQELIDEGRAALRAGDAAGARRSLEQALTESPSGDVVEALARVAYLDFDFPAAVEQWERAYAPRREPRCGSASRSTRSWWTATS